MPRHRIDRVALLRHLRDQFRLDWDGWHGIAHWARVRANGLLLAQQTGANTHVIELFAFFHDAARKDEGEDQRHGGRGARLAQDLQGRFFDASPDEMRLLGRACREHSDGLLECHDLRQWPRDHATVLSCWDADRLDLGRVGVKPLARYLCTAAARQPSFIEAAHERAVRDALRLSRQRPSRREAVFGP
ncbi:MAG TPA: hypothetical protein VN259_16965 [Xanthomonadales bacterium]|nr:hypothetical protein [Xanthomonadales bacterium]